MQSENGTMGMKYAMTVASFNIKYNVINCGFGMELIQSYGSNAERVKISRVSLSYSNS